MATSSPPSNVITFRTDSPSVLSSGGSLSPSMTGALAFLERLDEQGIVLAPRMPNAEALALAAQKSGISAIQALTAYLAILDYE